MEIKNKWGSKNKNEKKGQAKKAVEKDLKGKQV